MIRQLPALALCLAFAVVIAPNRAEARPPMLRLWGQGHGALANGQGNFFGNENGPYVGFGGAVGVQVIVFEAFFEVNVFDIGRDAGEQHSTMFNVLGGGLNIPVSLHEKVRLFGRADLMYTFAPYDSPYASTGENNGYTVRGGGGVDFLPNRFVAIGAAVYGGYHVFGTRAAGDNGSHLMMHLYTRFDLAI